MRLTWRPIYHKSSSLCASFCIMLLRCFNLDILKVPSARGTIRSVWYGRCFVKQFRRDFLSLSVLNSFELVLKLRTLSLCKTAINKIGRRFGSSPYSVCEMSEPLQKKNINNVNNKQTNKQTKNLRLHTHGECADEYVNTFVYFVFQRAKAVSFAWSGSFHILKPVNVIIGHFEEPF